MKRKIKVFLGDSSELLGYILYNAQGARENSAFEYSEEWIKRSGNYSIDPSLPLVVGPQFYRKIKDFSVFPSIKNNS